MVDGRSVEGLEDLRLEPGLLVKADAQVGEQETLGSRLRVGRGQRVVIPPERGPEMVLAVGRSARPERGAEALDRVLGSAPALSSRARKRANSRPISSEHLQVSPGDASLARASAAVGEAASRIAPEMRWRSAARSIARTSAVSRSMTWVRASDRPR
jgi:hypothetical protein